jgi:hypothetical protein
MTFLPYIVPAYGLGVLLPVTYAALAWRRMRLSERRLAATERRPRQAARPLKAAGQ